MTVGSGALAYSRRSASHELWKCLNIDAAAEHERSLETLRTSCAGSPRDWELRLALARALLGLGRAAEAVIPAEQALAIQPEVTAVMQVHRAVTEALQASDPDLVRLELACSLAPEDGTRHIVLGETYAAIKRYRDAERHLQLALACGSSQEACADLAALYLSIGRPDLAEGYATTALKHDHSAITHANARAMAHQTLAAVFSAKGDQASSTKHLDAAYTERSFFHQPASNSTFTTLVLVTRSEGNIPYKSLLPPLGSSYVIWYMEHARLEDISALPPYHVVLNAIGDPDAAAASRAMIDHFTSKCEWPIINLPRAVDRTRRDKLGETLAGIGHVVVPLTTRVAGGRNFGTALCDDFKEDGERWPMIFRPLSSHGGKGLELVHNAVELEDTNVYEGGYLSPFHDYRSADGYFRKYRVIFIDRRPFPYHLAISRYWMVHHDTAEMAGDPDRINEEMHFLCDPLEVIGARALAALEAIGQRLDLDYAGIDFAVTNQGEVLVFEANATMLTHLEAHDSAFVAKNRFIHPIIDAFQAHWVGLGRNRAKMDMAIRGC